MGAQSAEIKVLLFNLSSGESLTITGSIGVNPHGGF